MFTIDLLKGQGIPIKSRPESIALAAVTLAVPVIAAIVIFGLYISNSIAMTVQKSQMANYETHIQTLSDAVKLQKSYENKKNIINTSLTEVASSTNRHTQWSPILVTLVENLPASVVLTGLEVKQHSVKKKVPQKGNPKKMIDITVPARILHMKIRGTPQSNCDKAVKDFRQRLLRSTLLAPLLENITVSQGFGTLDGQDVVSYEVDCIFKPQL